MAGHLNNRFDEGTDEDHRSHKESRSNSKVSVTLAGLVLAIGICLRLAARSEFWLDEALTVNIASLPLSDLGDALRHDGAPPLYYVLLHWWISIFGDGKFAVRALSGVFSIATMPVLWFAARRCANERAAWITLLLLASSAYAVRFATEARMYSLQMLLASGAFLAVLRAIERPTIARLAPVGLATGLLMLNQYWSFYLLATGGLLLLIGAVRGSRTQPARRVVMAMAVGAALLFGPWIPTFLYQIKHTGTPWGTPVTPFFGVGLTITDLGGISAQPHSEAWIFLFSVPVLILIGLMGIARDEWHIELDLRTIPRARIPSVLTLGTLLVGFSVSLLSGAAYQSRYASPIIPFALLAVSLGICVFENRRVRYGIIGILVIAGLIGSTRGVFQERSQAREIATAIIDTGRPGDVVVYCPDQLGPDTERLIPEGFIQMAFPGGDSPEFVDWVDYAKRQNAGDPIEFVTQVIEVAGTANIWFVWAGDYRTLDEKCQEIDSALQSFGRHPLPVVDSDNKVIEHASLYWYPGL